jgi:hypothetical protein
VIIAETGIEADARADWLRYVSREAMGARALGVRLEAVCLYPIVDHPGWEDDRHCPNGLWGYANRSGERPIDRPFAEELERQQRAFAAGPEVSERIAGVGESLDPEEQAALDRAARLIDEETEKSREGGRRRRK